MFADRYRFALEPHRLELLERSTLSDLFNDPRSKLRALRGVAPHWREIRAGYNAFDDRESRAIFRDLLVYRYLTPHLSRVANNRQMADALAAFMAEDRQSTPLVSAPSILNEPIALWSVSYNGVPAKVAQTRYGLYWTIVSEQYYFRRGGICVGPAPDDIVLDCGACLGDTALKMAAHVGPRGHVYSFDPLPSHITIARDVAQRNGLLWQADRAHDHSHAAAISFINCGVARETTGKADAPASREPSRMVASVDASHRLTPADATITIDDFCRHRQLARVNYIKMDIEGLEAEALAGAHETIARFKPKLAVCLYHKPSDLWMLPADLKRRYPFYDLYLAHHSLHGEETVMYAIAG